MKILKSNKVLIRHKKHILLRKLTPTVVVIFELHTLTNHLTLLNIYLSFLF